MKTFYNVMFQVALAVFGTVWMLAVFAASVSMAIIFWFGVDYMFHLIF